MADQAAEALRRLRRTPTLLRRASAGRSDAQLRRPPEGGGWSLNEVLAHLRGAADVQGGWIVRMLAADVPTIRYASPRTGMRKGGYADLAFAANLAGFVAERAALVKTLAALTSDGWARQATFTGVKPAWTPSVLDLAAGMAAHEQSHAEQIEATVAAIA